MTSEFFGDSGEAVNFMEELVGEIAVAQQNRHKDRESWIQLCVCHDFVVGMAIPVIREAVEAIAEDDLPYSRYFAQVISSFLEVNSRYLRRGLERSVESGSTIPTDMWDMRIQAMNGLAELSRDIRKKWSLMDNAGLDISIAGVTV